MNRSAKEPDDPTENVPPAAGDLLRPLMYRSEDLLGGRSEAWIEHRGERYRLRLTSNGRLYLTK